MVNIVVTVLEEPKYSDSSKTEVTFKGRIEFKSSTASFGRRSDPVIHEVTVVIPDHKMDWALRFIREGETYLMAFHSIPGTPEKCYPKDIFFDN